jgi:xylose isomerase
MHSAAGDIYASNSNLFSLTASKIIESIEKIKYSTGEIINFTGIDAAYEKPVNTDLHLSTDQLSSEESVKKLYAFVVSSLKVTGSSQT